MKDVPFRRSAAARIAVSALSAAVLVVCVRCGSAVPEAMAGVILLPIKAAEMVIGTTAEAISVKARNELEKGYLEAVRQMIDMSTIIAESRDRNSGLTGAATYQELRAFFSDRGAPAFPETDPWGNPYLYRETDGRSFDLGCAGSDGRFVYCAKLN